MMLSGIGVVGQSISTSHPSVIDTGAGTTADCATWTGWLLNSGCWKYSQSAWQQQNLFAEGITTLPQPVPPAAIPLTPSGQPDCSTPSCSAEIQASLNQSAQQTAQNTQAYFNAQGVSVPPASCGIFGGGLPTLDAQGNWTCPTDITGIALIAAAVLIGGIVLTGAVRR